MLMTLLIACTALKGGDSASACEATADLGAACACAEPSVEVGTGTAAFESLPDGSEVTMVHGPQGGWHVLAAARFANLAPIVSIHYTITTQPDGAVVSDNTYRVQMVAEGECGGYFPNMYGYLDVSTLADGDLDTPPELLGGTELILAMDVVDSEDRTASDSLTAIAALDPVDEEPE